MIKINKLLPILLFIFILTSCAHQSIDSEPGTDMLINVSHIETTYKEVSPGHVLLIQQDLSKEKKSSVDKLICDQKKIPFEIKKHKLNFYWAESYFSKSKSHNCYLYKASKLVRKVHIKVVPYEYPFEELTVNKRRVVVNKKDQLRAAKERAFLNRIYNASSKATYYKNGFIIPLESFVTSHYGKRRIFNGIRKTQHLGVDLRARTGVPIPSSQRGRVVFAGELFYTGNTVIIDHGLGVFTMYGHLSKLLVRMGAIVNQGQILGLAGSTGRSTASHLHWGTKIHGHWVDGMTLVEQTKDFSY